jgi:hypothetical protein
MGVLSAVRLGAVVETATGVATAAARGGAISTGAPEGDRVGVALELGAVDDGGGVLLGNEPERDMR